LELAIQSGETEFNEPLGNMIGYNLEERLPLSTLTRLVQAHFKDLKESERLLNEYCAGKAESYIF